MGDPLANVVPCTNAPPPRCYHRDPVHRRLVCGELATWLRPGRDWFNPEYFCDAHRLDCDVAIPTEHVFRRVRFEAWVYLAGVHAHAPAAHAEAAERLERAVMAAGGLLDVRDTHSAIVKSLPLPDGQRAIGTLGRQ